MYLRKIIVVIDVVVLTIETIKIVFKPVFLKQVHLLKSLDIFMADAFEIRGKKVTQGRERGCRQSLYRGTKNF